MRIGIVLPGPISYLGGAEFWVREIYKEVLKTSQQVTIFVPEENFDNLNHLEDLPIKIYDSKIYRVFKKLDLLNFYPPFIPYHKEFASYDTIYTTSMHCVRIFRRHKGKVVVGTHDAFVPNKKIGIDNFQFLTKLIIKITKKDVIIHAVSPLAYDTFKGTSKKIVLAENFLPLLINDIAMPRNFNIVFLGRVEKRKGADQLILLIEEIKKHPNINLFILGAISRRYDFIRINYDKFKNINIMGRVTDEVKYDVLKESSLMVFFSSRDTAPFVILEGLSCGLPITCTWKHADKTFPGFEIDIRKPKLTDIFDSVYSHYKLWVENENEYYALRKKIQLLAVKKFKKENSVKRILKLFE